jgi:hypothetical protein
MFDSPAELERLIEEFYPCRDRLATRVLDACYLPAP